VPVLSVVMTIVDGGPVLQRCLQALAAQWPGPEVEVLVPYDHMSQDEGRMAAEFPQFDFIDLGTILGGEVPANPFQMHAFYDTRRTEAMKRAKGTLIAIIEDRGVPDPQWCKTMMRLHRESPHGVIGGAVTNGVDRLWNWAIFFCDFGRYGPPLNEQEPDYVTDTNIVYKRDAIMSVRNLWDVKYQEAQVNWELRRRGAGLMLTDAAITEQNRPTVSTRALASERFHWARLFGQVRARELTGTQRIRIGLGIPLLPFLLFVRHFRRQLKKRRHVGKFVLATPMTLFLLSCWAAGEFVGNAETVVREE
jgi:GT2 family glycosyltransferase